MPTKTQYFVGDKLDLTGLCVTAVTEEGNVVELETSQYSIEPAQDTEQLIWKAGLGGLLYRMS